MWCLLQEQHLFSPKTLYHVSLLVTFAFPLRTSAHLAAGTAHWVRNSVYRYPWLQLKNEFFFFFFSVFGNKYLQKKTMGPLPLGERGWRILTLGWCLKFQEIKPFFFFFSSRFLKNRQMMGSSGDGSETFPSCFFFPGPSKCEVERYAAVRYQHAYVPSCDPDGGYTPVQCQQGGQCWCVDTKGREVQGTKRRGQPPACGMC